MSTEETTKNDVIYAKLVRGRVYFLGLKEFEYDVEQEITPEEHEWLVEHAVDQVTLESEGEHQLRQKFEFSFRPRDEKPKTTASSPRQRSR